MSKTIKKEPLGLNSSKLNTILSNSYSKKANKSLVSQTTNQYIQLSQSQVNFINTEANQVYEIVFTIRNVGQKSTKVKVRKPKSQFLSVNLEKDGNLAPGLEKKITISYNSQVNQQIKDRIFLYCEDQFDIEVPVCVYPLVYHLSYEPFINFGLLKTGSTKQNIIRIENKGNTTAQIRLELNIKGAKGFLDPNILQIQPKSGQNVTLTLHSEQSSQFQGFIQINPQVLGQSSIQFLGSFCQYSRYISDEQGKQINQLCLQSTFGGQRWTSKFYLVNNTPKPCQFRIIRKRVSNNEDQTVLLTPQQIGRDQEQKNIIFSTIEGQIEAYSKKQILCNIVSKIQDHDIQLFCNYISGRIKLLPYDSKDWCYMISTTFKDEDGPKNLVIKGESIIPKLSISSIFFKFGDCPLRSRQQKILKVQNLTDRTVSITIEKSQNYSCLPQTFDISKDGSKEVLIRFHPKVIGQLNEICYLKVGMFGFPIKMFGTGIFAKQTSKKVQNKDASLSMDLSRGVEVQLGDIDKTILEQEISVINERSVYHEQNSKISTTNFDCSGLTSKAKSDNKNIVKKRALRNKNGKEVVVDIQNFNPDEEVDQYPGLGRSAQEDRIVMRELTLNQFKNIPVGPVILDFGEIFVSSAQTKTFHICNLNLKPISIQIETKGHQQFEKSGKQIQILPSQSHGGLKIIYEAHQQGVFKHPLQYIINGRHYFQILAIGSAILPTIQPSKTQFKFIAGQDDHTFEKRQGFNLNNLYPYPVEYSFGIQKESLFKITPQRGRIQPNGKQAITISHNFYGILEGGGKIEQNLKLKVKNGKNIDIKCTSIVPECHVICKPNQCNFKQISVCKQHEMKFSIKNSSKNFTVFKIVPNKDIQQEVRVIATKNMLAVDEIAQVTVKISSQKEEVIDSGLSIIVRGGKKMYVSIKANIIIPKVRIQAEEINFGTMPVGGSPMSKLITLINQSSIPAELQLVLQSESYLYKCLSIKNESSQLKSISTGRDQKEKKGKVFGIKIAKKCKTQICLEFQPEQVKDYKFMLPLYLTGSNELNPYLQKTVICRSTKNRLLADRKQIDFGKIIIEQSLANLQKNLIFTLHNPLDEQIEWWVIDKNIEPFSLQVKKGSIKGQSEMKIKVFFQSENPGIFQKELNFFVNNSDLEVSKPYLKIPIKATANYPQIYFDRPYVILPTVRLNEYSEMKFQILNGGYENLNIKHVINQQLTNIDLTIKYLNGSNLGVTKKSITLVASFKSERPISFTEKVQFYDHHNRVFSIFISGTADNSLYSIPQSSWTGNINEQLSKSCSFLTTFINSLGFVEDILYDFPSCLWQNQFFNFHKLLQYFTTQTEKLQKFRLNLKKATHQDIYQYLSQVIKMLKSEGAFLNQIRPQFLMNQNDHNQVIKLKAENQRAFSNYKVLSPEQFTERNMKSWIILTYQILRVFSKVNAKKKLLSTDIWSQMLQKQKTIINWLEQCYQNQANLEEAKSSSDLSDLGDGEMLSALITKYTNIKILDAYGKTNTNQKEKEKRCKKIIQILSQIGVVPGIKVEDLIRSRPVQMLVFLQRLYLILPFYLQKGEPILFSCAIGQSLTKSIQIKNPSKFPVTYFAKIQGSKAYMIENEQQFVIQAKQKHEVIVKYISNVDIDKNNGALTLTGKTSFKYTPSTFIFVLKSQSLGRISQKSIQISGQLYQPYQFQLNIKNNFLGDAAFAVQIFTANSKVQSKSLFCSLPLIKARKDESVSVPFIFFPFTLETHKFQLIFKDPKVGQFQYDLTALVDIPQIIPDPIKLSQVFFTNKTYAIEVPIPQRNEQMLKSRKQYEMYVEKMYRKNQNQSNNSQNRRGSVKIQKNLYPFLKQEIYSLSLSPVTDMVTLKTNSLNLDPEEDQSASTKKFITLEINMKMPIKQAPIYLTLKNASNTDIRRYKILVSSAYKPLRYQLQIKVPVNQTISQPLPLINVSNQPNTFTTTFVTNQTALSRNVFTFTNQKDIIVKPKDQMLVNLGFCPKVQQTYSGLLRIQNTTSGQVVQYEVNGVGEQPIAQAIKFQQKTGETKKHQIKLPYTRPQKCTVTKCTFSNKNIKYEKVFSFNTEYSCLFKFDFIAKIPGVYEGKIYLQDDIKIHAYNITITVAQSLSGIIEIKSIERQKKQASIFLEKGLWNIQYFDSNLIIPEQIELPEAGPFNFSYFGSKAGDYESQLIFKNETAGYYKYLLKVKIEEQPQMLISDMKAELGKNYVEIIKLENPEANTITVTGSCTNSETFYFQPDGPFTIPGKGFKEIKIVFRPTCLEMQTGKIHFISNNDLKWKYELNGTGILQAEEQIKEIDAQINQQIIETINFVNPFKRTVFAYIFLENKKETEPSQLKLMNKNTKYALEYLQQIQIPIKFRCSEAKRYECRIKLLINEKIYWRYLLNIRTIYRSQDEARSYKFPSRNKKELTISFFLPYLCKQQDSITDKFKCLLTASEPNSQNLLRSTCRVLKDWQPRQENKVSFLLNFLSYRPFVCPFLFQIYQENNCKWVFKGQIDFATPPPDDQFEIIAQINKPTSVMFRLNNRVKSHAKFKAYFTSDSDMEFNINPKNGDLEPYGREGSQFQVTFAPTQYRNSWHGKIVIQTDDSFWSYLVKGNLPHYTPPIGKSLLVGLTKR